MPPTKRKSTPFEILRRPTGRGWKLIRDAGRPAEVVEFDKAVVRFFLESSDLLGVPNSVAAIYGICFASPDPLHFYDITERLAISAGAVNMGLQFLRKIGALKVVPAPAASVLAAQGRRRPRGDYYTPDMELRKVAMHFLRDRLEKQLDSGETRLKTISDSIPVSEDPAGAEELRHRLRQLQTWHDKARGLVPLAKIFLQLDQVKTSFGGT